MRFGSCTSGRLPRTGRLTLPLLLVCHAALSGGEDDEPEDARTAFVEAAHEARLTVLYDDNLDW
ncbi:DUF982 domain-containing protein [Agrobacterium cavarae]|uniref:DUF982 domain-containing protein n=1 Tax=Agrobacterium cavarae TaxID=2528239 RepID=UPI0028B0D644|nr:DUF982 domain-containing protein [Agrobacterium cavarae]